MPKGSCESVISLCNGMTSKGHCATLDFENSKKKGEKKKKKKDRSVNFKKKKKIAVSV